MQNTNSSVVPRSLKSAVLSRQASCLQTLADSRVYQRLLLQTSAIQVLGRLQASALQVLGRLQASALQVLGRLPVICLSAQAKEVLSWPPNTKPRDAILSGQPTKIFHST